MTPSRARLWLTVWMALHAVVAAVLVARMPADAWFASDPGTRYIAVQNLMRHPDRPLEIDLPAVPAELAHTLKQYLFVPHGDHAHAVTSQIFPVLSAPFVRWLGPIGLAVLPVIGWVLMGPLTARLAAILGVRAPAWLIIVTTAAATPFVFYGMEGWEHVPAVALIVASAALLLSPAGGRGAACGAGLCAALAVQLRPEMAAVVIAVAIIAFLRGVPMARTIACGAGLAIGVLPLLIYNWAHFGTPVSPHVGANLDYHSVWWWQRQEFLTRWFVPSRRYMANAFAVFVLGMLLARLKGLRTAGVTVCCAIAIGLAFEEARRHEIPENFFRVFPLGLLAFIPIARWSAARRDLWIWCGVVFAGCLLTAPNDGGSQWGPRYLQATVPALLCLGLDGLGSTTLRRGVAWAVGAWVMAAGFVVSYQAWHDLRESKRFAERMVHRTAAEAERVSFVVTDVWWLATYHAAAIDARRMLVVDAPAAAVPVIRAIAPADVLMVANMEDDPAGVASLWSTAGCVVVDQAPEIPGDPIRLWRLSCR